MTWPTSTSSATTLAARYTSAGAVRTCGVTRTTVVQATAAVIQATAAGTCKDIIIVIK